MKEEKIDLDKIVKDVNKVFDKGFAKLDESMKTADKFTMGEK